MTNFILRSKTPLSVVVVVVVVVVAVVVVVVLSFLLLFCRWERRVLCALYTLIRTGGSALRIFDEGKGGAGKCQGRGYRSVVIVLSLCCRLIILALQLLDMSVSAFSSHYCSLLAVNPYMDPCLSLIFLLFLPFNQLVYIPQPKSRGACQGRCRHP